MQEEALYQQQLYNEDGVEEEEHEMTQLVDNESYVSIQSHDGGDITDQDRHHHHELQDRKHTHVASTAPTQVDTYS